MVPPTAVGGRDRGALVSPRRIPSRVVTTGDPLSGRQPAPPSTSSTKRISGPCPPPPSPQRKKKKQKEETRPPSAPRATVSSPYPLLPTTRFVPPRASSCPEQNESIIRKVPDSRRQEKRGPTPSSFAPPPFLSSATHPAWFPVPTPTPLPLSSGALTLPNFALKPLDHAHTLQLSLPLLPRARSASSRCELILGGRERRGEVFE